MISFYCFISRHAQCGIILFSNCLYCAGFSADFCNKHNQNGRPQFVSEFSLQSLECVDFCIAPSPRRNILCDKKMHAEEDKKLWNLYKAKRHTLARSRKLWENLMYEAELSWAS